MSRAVVLETAEAVPEKIKQTFLLNGIEIVKAVSVNDFHEDADFLLEYSSELTSEDIVRFVSRAIGRPLVIGTTDRLIIRELSTADYSTVQNLYNSCKTAFSDSFYSTFVESPATLKEYVRFQYPIFGYGLWLITLKNSPLEALGLAGFYSSDSSVYASYALFAKYRGNGYCQEAMSYILEYADTRLGIKNVCAEIATDNVISKHIADKLGLIIINR